MSVRPEISIFRGMHWECENGLATRNCKESSVSFSECENCFPLRTQKHKRTFHLKLWFLCSLNDENFVSPTYHRGLDQCSMVLMMTVLYSVRTARNSDHVARLTVGDDDDDDDVMAPVTAMLSRSVAASTKLPLDDPFFRLLSTSGCTE